MSKCSVLRTRHSKSSHCTLLRPKYCAEASKGKRARARRVRSGTWTARLDLTDNIQILLGLPRRTSDHGGINSGEERSDGAGEAQGWCIQDRCRGPLTPWPPLPSPPPDRERGKNAAGFTRRVTGRVPPLPAAGGGGGG